MWHQVGVTILLVTHDIDESVYLGERVLAELRTHIYSLIQRAKHHHGAPVAPKEPSDTASAR